MTGFTSTDALASEPPGSLSAPLLPRYRRPLSFGAILDETFRIFRRAWRPLMLALAAAAVPIGLITAIWTASFSSSFFQIVDATDTASGEGDFGPLASLYGGLYGGALVVGLLSALFLVPAYAAVVYLADGELRGRTLPVTDALKRGLRVTPKLLLSGLLFILLSLLLLVASSLALLLWVIPGLFGLTPLIGTLVWWASPGARKPWLCWLIILTTPLGLSMYFTYRWIVALPAIALEGRGPAAAISRSQALTRGHWFRLFGSFTVLGIISSILQAVPTWIVSIVVGGISFIIAFNQAGSGSGGELGDDPLGLMTSVYTVTNIASAAAQALGMALVGAIPPIALTLLYQDLRNRHEGADLAERLDAASAAPTDRPPAGASAGPSAGPATVPATDL